MKEKQCRQDGRCQYAINHGAEGLGHCPPGKCAMPEQQAQAGEPEVVAWFDPGSARAWNSNFKDRCYPLITLQSHREAVRGLVFAERHWRLKATAAQETIAKKDAALKTFKRLLMQAPSFFSSSNKGDASLERWFDERHDSITQAQEALK